MLLGEKANASHRTEVQAMLVNYQHKVQERYFQTVTLERKHARDCSSRLYANAPSSHLVILEVLNESL